MHCVVVVVSFRPQFHCVQCALQKVHHLLQANRSAAIRPLGPQ